LDKRGRKTRSSPKTPIKRLQVETIAPNLQIFEADIKACFDNIRHDWILKNIPVNKTILNEWLKAGYIEKKRLFATEKGTPQGFDMSSAERLRHELSRTAST
jgi:retron-type reverse transcriptase